MWRLVFIILLLFANNVLAETVAYHDFNDNSFGPFSAGDTWSIQQSGGIDNSRAAMLSITKRADGTSLSKSVLSYKSREYWVEFDVKVTGTLIGGHKFIKFFGAVDGWSHNNMTVGIEEGSHKNEGVGFYDDSRRFDRWTGPPASGNYTGSVWNKTGEYIDIRGGGWGRIKVWVKRALPNTRDGEIKIWWKGNLVSHISNMDSYEESFADTIPGFKSIQLGGYVHEGFVDGVTAPWYLWVDNLYMGTTEQGDTTPELLTCYPDLDNDLYPGSGSQSAETCPANYFTFAHFTSMETDCNDTNLAINPGATEICGNSIDDDCNGYDEICLEELECSATYFNLCDVTQCSALGLYPWGGTCNTVPQPASIVSDNLILNSNLVEWTSTLPENYTSYQESDISKSSLGANMDNGALLNPLYFLTPDTTYTAVFNLIRIQHGTSKLWSYGFSSDITSGTTGTVVHEFTTPSVLNDKKIYIGSSLSSNVDINNIRLYTTTTLSCTDLDGDGYSIEGELCGIVDCDDTNAAINPGETEICGNGVDDNCVNGDEVCDVVPVELGPFWLYKNSLGRAYIPAPE